MRLTASALFKDLVRQDVGGMMRDYLLLEYAEGDKLFVPVEQLDRVTRYVGPEGRRPLHAFEHERLVARAFQGAQGRRQELAFDLVDVYTRRASSAGLSLRARYPLAAVMEEAFPYDETPDQLAAIAEVKADMRLPSPWIAWSAETSDSARPKLPLRAAFKATQDNKQVMVLCPTTILAQQHYTTFKERFDPFDVRVEVLSRFPQPCRAEACARRVCQRHGASVRRHASPVVARREPA